MAEASTVYPQMPVTNWWALRQRFVQSMPANVTASYLSAVLSMSESSATNNLIRPLKRVGLIDQEGKPTERAYKWRDDDQYSQACKEIREAVYPQELLDAFPGANNERSAIERWFRNNARVGENASKKMANLYQLLVEADPSKQDEKLGDSKPKARQTKDSGVKSGRTTNTGSRTENSQAASNTSDGEGERQTPDRQPVLQNGPSLHIDVQIHIASEASAEQIEAIFASMAKHLYKSDNA